MKELIKKSKAKALPKVKKDPEPDLTDEELLEFQNSGEIRVAHVFPENE